MGRKTCGRPTAEEKQEPIQQFTIHARVPHLNILKWNHILYMFPNWFWLKNIDLDFFANRSPNIWICRLSSHCIQPRGLQIAKPIRRFFSHGFAVNCTCVLTAWGWSCLKTLQKLHTVNTDLVCLIVPLLTPFSYGSRRNNHFFHMASRWMHLLKNKQKLCHPRCWRSITKVVVIWSKRKTRLDNTLIEQILHQVLVWLHYLKLIFNQIEFEH